MGFLYKMMDRDVGEVWTMRGCIFAHPMADVVHPMKKPKFFNLSAVYELSSQARPQGDLRISNPPFCKRGDQTCD